MNLVIVESPAKAKTINKYLGNDFNVLASFGHVRDLPSKNGSVNPDDNFSFEWEVSNTSKKHMKEIYEASEKALAAHDNNIPFYVALPSSTIDWNIKDYKNIPIEERNS